MDVCKNQEALVADDSDADRGCGLLKALYTPGMLRSILIINKYNK